jgi:ribose 1,5-bisphosphokinase
MGPSGVGKGSVLGWVREHGVPLGVVCAHRYITRPALAGDANHVVLSEQEFAAREQRGLFVLTWTAHGWRYGIGREIEHWMNRGRAAHSPMPCGAFPICSR